MDADPYSATRFAGEAGAASAPVVHAGIDIGGTKTSCVLVADSGVIARATAATPIQRGGAAIAGLAAELCDALVERSGGRLAGVGVGAAGIIDPETGTVRAASSTFAGWTGFPLRAELARRLHVPVQVENDVNAFLLGELAADPSDDDNALGLMLGTGVGGALVLDGKLRRGAHGGAGEIGHTPGYGDLPCTCGQRGHLETRASGLSIARGYAERTGRNSTAADIASLARTGDEDARAVFAEAGRAAALACVSAAGILELTRAVIGGGVAQAWDLLEPGVTATLRENAPVSGVAVQITRARLGQDAVALGAVAAAKRMTSQERDGELNSREGRRW